MLVIEVRSSCYCITKITYFFIYNWNVVLWLIVLSDTLSQRGQLLEMYHFLNAYCWGWVPCFFFPPLGYHVISCFCTKLLDVVWSDFTRSKDVFEAFRCLWFGFGQPVTSLFCTDWIKVLNVRFQWICTYSNWLHIQVAREQDLCLGKKIAKACSQANIQVPPSSKSILRYHRWYTSKCPGCTTIIIISGAPAKHHV